MKTAALPKALITFAAILFFAVAHFWIFSSAAIAEEQSIYVGTDACQDCHEEQCSNFKQYAKKAKSAHSVQKMAPKLTTEELNECYACHTTGYGKTGGFVSYEKTPHLGDAGCEVCHGPGSLHVEYGGDPEYIRQPSIDDCSYCHNEERIDAFGFKPMLHGGAH